MRLVSVSNRVTVILLFKPRWHTTHSPHSTETKSKTHLVAVVLVSDTNCYAIPISLGLFRLLLWPEMPTTKNNSQRRSSCVFCIDTKRPLNLRLRRLCLSSSASFFNGIIQSYCTGYKILEFPILEIPNFETSNMSFVRTSFACSMLSNNKSI